MGHGPTVPVTAIRLRQAESYVRQRKELNLISKPSWTPGTSEPPYTLVNRYHFPRVASGVYDKASEVIETTDVRDLSVYTYRGHGAVYVAVMGDTPAPNVRKKLAHIFAVGAPVEITEMEAVVGEPY